MHFIFVKQREGRERGAGKEREGKNVRGRLLTGTKPASATRGEKGLRRRLGTP